jgi:hypothetical protein
MSEQPELTLIAFDQLEMMLLALSPDEYEETFHTFAQEKATHAMEVPSGSVYYDREGNIHMLNGGDYISILDISAWMAFLARTIDDQIRREGEEQGPVETFVQHLLQEHFQSGELEEFFSLCRLHEGILSGIIGGDDVYLVGYNREDEGVDTDDPFEERCMFHADAVARIILALGKYLDYRDQVNDAIQGFLTKQDEKYEYDE